MVRYLSTFIAGLSLAACTSPDATGLFQDVQLTIVDDEAAAAEPFVALVDGATSRLRVALPHGQDTAIAEAVVRAWDRDVDVKVIADVDNAEEPGVKLLLDAGVPTKLASGDVAYFDFAINRDVSWTSEQTLMTHAFAVADRQRLVAASAIGLTGPGTRVVMSARGEDIAIDFEDEHNQIFGGTDAIALTGFSNAAKSITKTRWAYPAQSDVVLEVYFGPQERVTKRVIDAVYSARSSVRVLTNDFSNEGLSIALQDKAKIGVDVEVIVGPRFASVNTMLSRQLTNNTPDVVKRRISGLDLIPTVVLIDMQPRGGSYRDLHPRAFVLTHDLMSASRLFRGQEVVTDQYYDGTLFVLGDSVDEPDPQLRQVEAVYDAHRALSGGF